MPTMATATIIAHLSAAPASGETADGKTWARFRAWTKESVKPRDGGERRAVFTSWSGFVSGKAAEWLAEQGRKGSLVAISGTIRLADKWTDRDGKERDGGIEFVHVESCMVLAPPKADGEADGAGDRPAASRPAASSATRTAPRPQAQADGEGFHDEPPF